MSLFSENRLLYRKASDFGYSSTSDAKVESRDLARQTQVQQQSNLDAQRQQEAQVQKLNANSTDTNYYRAPGAADQGTTIVGQTTKLGTDGNPVSSPTRLEGSVTMDRSLPQKASTSSTNLASAVDARLNERLAERGVPKESYAEVKKILDAGGRIIEEVDGMPVFLMPDGSKRTIAGVNGSVVRGATDVAGMDLTTEVQGELDAEAQANRDTLLAKQGEQTAGTEVTPPPPSPVAAGAGAAFANLPPEAAFLAPFLEQFQNSINQSLSENAGMTEGLLGQVQKTYGGIEQQLADMREGYLASNEAMQGLLEDAKEQNDKYIAEQQKAEQERLAWDEYKLRRDTSKRKREDHDAMVAQIALAGGFGQDAGIRAVMESDAEYDSKMADLATQFSFARTDLSAKYTALYTENQNNYVTKTMENMKELRGALERIGMQSISNATARQKAEQDILTTGWTNQTNLRKELATENLSVAKQMSDMISEARQEERQTKADLWERFFRQRAQDGNTNPGLTSQILREMQAAGINTSGIDPNAMTIDQINELHRQQAQADASSGKVPLATQVKLLADADNAFALLDRAEAAITEYSNVGGPVAGMTGIGDIDKETGFVGDLVNLIRTPIVAGSTLVPGIGNNLERQREAVATFNLVKQVIGKAMEGGVLRKEDEAKYERLLPTLRDTDRLRAYKLQQLREAMMDGKNALLNSMSSAGYNTSGYNFDSSGNPLDPLRGTDQGPLTNDDADEILQHLESGEPLSQGTPTGFLTALANAHMKHEGYGTAGATTITTGNNPGALRWHPGQAKFGGKPGPKNFTVFPDFNSGYKALVADLRAKLTGNSSHIDYSANPTLLSYVKVYAPTADGNNPTGYAAAVVRDLKKSGYNVSLNTPLSELTYLLG